nr:DNA gyrase subunit A [Maliibacterium massiliense]
MNEQENTKQRIIPVNIEREMKTSFIAYAMAVIINRALPDVRDGLKPVHRRILYSMSELGLSPDKPFRKSARIVGDVLGKYHPHGDTAVYDSMVRMAQDFSMRYPLVQGHGNFGSVDGDGAAAMRYTEARMSKLAMQMIADIDKDTVAFGPNFDGTAMQPMVLPSRYPNLLVNGSGGIAVGMATNIPPHNIGEVIDGAVALIDDPEISVDELMRYIPGPDFPTGGIVMGTMGIREAYRTGRGRIVVRAKTEIEQMTPTRARIIVTEIPYQVNKARLVEKIAELVHEKRVEGISDLRDESDRNGMRIVIELKQNVNASVVLNLLYKHTQLQDTFGAIMIALVDGEPRLLDLKSILYHYVEHQKDVITRRTRYELERAEARAHILEGLLIALDYIDAVIALIRGSKTQAEAKAGLIEKFNLSERQAQAILEMRLQRLVGLERARLQEEYAKLTERISYYRAVLADEKMVLGIVREELLAVRDQFDDERRTEITALADEIDLADLIEEKDVVITLTHFGYVKRLASDTYRTQRRGGRGISALSKREEDFVENVFTTSTHQDIMFFTNMGKMFLLKGYEIPEASRTARGTAIVNLLPLEGAEKITACFPVPELESEQAMLVMATKRGIIKKTPLGEFRNMRRSGLRAIVLREDDELMGVQLTDGAQEILVGTRGGMSIRFCETDIRPMGRSAMGVRAVRLRSGDEVVGMEKIAEDAQVLVVSANGFGKRTLIEEYRAQARGGKGVRTLAITDKTGPMVGLRMVTEQDDIMLISDDGTIIRMEADSIRLQGRATQGVTLMRLAGDAHVVAVAVAAKSEEDEGEDGDMETDAPDDAEV